MTYLAERAFERQQKNRTELIERFPAFTDFQTPIFLGSYSWTFPLSHERMLYNPTAVTIGNGPQTPGEITRDYLDWKYPKRLRCVTDQWRALTVHRAYPCFARPGAYDDMVYLDIKSAYWSILSIFGWDADYFPGRWLGVRSNVFDFPLQDNKPARSGLVTAGLSSPTRFWTGSALQWRTTENKHVNLGLWALVQDVLHGVADDMLGLGAVYVHTDGYIIPAENLAQGSEILNDWGLRGNVKAHGDANVLGVGSYRVGDFQTKRTGVIPSEMFSISPVEKHWLRTKCHIFSERLHKGIVNSFSVG
jgi:hypothetical protein